MPHQQPIKPFPRQIASGPGLKFRDDDPLTPVYALGHDNTQSMGFEATPYGTKVGIIARDERKRKREEMKGDR